MGSIPISSTRKPQFRPRNPGSGRDQASGVDRCGALLGRKGFAEPVVELFCEPVVEARHDVSVHVQGRRDRGVAQTVFDGLWVCAGFNGETHRGVSEFVEDVTLKSRRVQRRVQVAANEVGPADRPSPRRGEQVLG